MLNNEGIYQRIKIEKKRDIWPGMVVYTFNPSTWEAEVGRSLSIQGLPGPQSEFQGSQGYTEKRCLSSWVGAKCNFEIVVFIYFCFSKCI